MDRMRPPVPMTTDPRLRLLAWMVLVLPLCLGHPVAAQELPPSGPHAAVMEHDAAQVPALTIYRPRDLAQLTRLPVVAWGNGGCRANGGAAARRFLLELASHGYLVLALGKPGPDAELRPTSNRNPSPRLDAVPPGEDETRSTDLIAALDWAAAEHRREGSIYRGRLDPERAAVMGHSCGGLQALAVQGDTRIAATAIWNSGIYDRPPGRVGVRLGKDALARVRSPILYAHGGPSDIAAGPADSDFALLPAGVPAVKLVSGVGHAGTFAQARGGSYAVVARAWLDAWLKGDRSALKVLAGPDCTLCRDADWTLARRALD